MSGEAVVSIGPSRQVTVRKYKSTVLVDIREFYEKDGEQLPGRKGISLTAPQWQSLLDQRDIINEALASLGASTIAKDVPTPKKRSVEDHEDAGKSERPQPVKAKSTDLVDESDLANDVGYGSQVKNEDKE